MQNRKSAKKCRLKKKAEFSDLKSEVDNIAAENQDLKRKVRILITSDGTVRNPSLYKCFLNCMLTSFRSTKSLSCFTKKLKKTPSCNKKCRNSNRRSPSSSPSSSWSHSPRACNPPRAPTYSVLQTPCRPPQQVCLVTASSLKYQPQLLSKALRVRKQRLPAPTTPLLLSWRCNSRPRWCSPCSSLPCKLATAKTCCWLSYCRGWADPLTRRKMR